GAVAVWRLGKTAVPVACSAQFSYSYLNESCSLVRYVIIPPSSRWMSCLTTSATRRSRIVAPAVLTASAAASSHDVLLVPMTSITLYTLMSCSSRPWRPTQITTPTGDDPSTCPGAGGTGAGHA